MKQSGSSRANAWRRLAIAALTLAGVALAFVHFAEIDRFVALAKQARPQWLAGALALQVLTYLCLAQGWRSVLASAGQPVSLGRLVPVALTKLFADQAMPSAGLGGHLVTIARLRGLGVPRATAMAAVLLTLIGYYLSYAACSLAVLGLLWLNREGSAWLTGVVTLFLAVAVTIPALALWLRGRGSRPLPDWLEAIGPARRVLGALGDVSPALLHRPALIARVTLWNGLIFVLDAATLATCLLAVGAPAHPAGAFIALIMASIATTLSPVPMGLGTFEATSVAMLAMARVPFAEAVTATLLLRGLTLWLPLAPGLVLLRRTRQDEPRDRA